VRRRRLKSFVWGKKVASELRLFLKALRKFDEDHGFFLSSGITFAQSYRFSHFLDIGPILRFILKYPMPFFFTFWMSFLIYKIVPNKKIQFKPALQAAFFTSLLWEVAKQLFGWYVLHLGRFSMVYGSLSTLVIFFLWIYYSSATLILGGEVAFLLEKGRNR
jgi:membrane protein